MLEIYTWSVLIAAIFFGSFGAFSYFHNSKDKQNQLFGLLSFVFTIWSLSWFFMLKAEDTTQALFWARALNSGATLIPIFYFHWVLTVLKKVREYIFVLVPGYLLTAFFLLMSFGEMYIPSTHEVLFLKFWPTGSDWHFLFVILGYAGIVGFGFLLLVKNFLHSRNELRYQLGYIIIGSLLGFVGGATNFPLMYGFNNPVFLFGIVLVIFCPFVLSYAVIKYNLLNLRVLGAEVFGGVTSLIFLINLLISKSTADFFINGLMFFFAVIFVFFLIRGVIKEVQIRRQVEKLAKQLEAANVRLKELDQLKSEFVSIASHQLRSPLAAIKGYASLILEGSFGKVPPAIHEAVDKIFDSSKGLTLVVEDFLNVSRIEQGRMKYEFAEADLEKLVKDTVEELMPSVKRKSLTISFGTDNKPPYKSYVDVGKIKQVLGNLIDNAIKYTPQGSIKVTLSKPTSEKIRIAISDTGVGIDASTIPLLFAKFTRAKDANKVNITGTSLGLYVAKEMVDAHKGRIWAESAGNGRGSTFCVELQGLQFKGGKEIVSSPS